MPMERTSFVWRLATSHQGPAYMDLGLVLQDSCIEHVDDSQVILEGLQWLLFSIATICDNKSVFSMFDLPLKIFQFRKPQVVSVFAYGTLRGWALIVVINRS